MQLVTGMDLSNNAIALARSLNSEVAIPSDFVCCNLCDLLQHSGGTFNIVFTSYGVFGWLPDLNRWAAVIAHFLKPGGTFFTAEFQPVVWMMDENFEHIKYYYHNK